MLDSSTVVFDHFLGDIQTQSGAFGAGGEKRVENLLRNVLIDTGSVIDNIDKRTRY